MTRLHDMSGTPEYHAWESMRTRCHAGEDSVHYSKYKGRGIKVCEEWEKSFVAFFEHVGPKPSPLHTWKREVGHAYRTTAKYSCNQLCDDRRYYSECSRVGRPCRIKSGNGKEAVGARMA